jgi:hypothetical protein
MLTMLPRCVAKKSMQISNILYARHRFTAEKYLVATLKILKTKAFSKNADPLNKEEEQELIEYLKFRLHNTQSPETDQILLDVLTMAMVIQLSKTGNYIIVVEENYNWTYQGI